MFEKGNGSFEFFSSSDLNNAKMLHKEGIKTYVYTGGGKLKYYDGNKGKVSVIFDDLPIDPHESMYFEK